MKGLGGKVDDRRKSPGTVKSGKHTFEAHGAQKPCGVYSMAKKGKK